MEAPYLNSNKLFSLVVFVTWYGLYIENDGGAPGESVGVVA